MEEFDFGGEIVWRPSAAQIESSNLREFMQRHSFPTYEELFLRSTDDIAWFWNTVMNSDSPVSSVSGAE